jgi:hypothetical protein
MFPIHRHFESFVIALGLVIVSACASSSVHVQQGVDEASGHPMTASSRQAPSPISYPLTYESALDRGTRTDSGQPGAGYWQQWADYTLTTRILPEEKRLEGEAAIVYRNNSPDTLRTVYLHLHQNLHSEGAVRRIPQEVTGGVELGRVAVDGQELQTRQRRGPTYEVTATQLGIRLPSPLPPEGSVSIEIDWAFKIPKAGASGRMGWDADNLFYLAYWYPQMAVYDDVAGWQVDWFTGMAEFYAGFGSYDLTVEAPQGWVVRATGRLENPDEVLSPDIVSRLRSAEDSDEVVHVVTADDFDTATQTSDSGTLTWRFVSDTVRDVTFSVTRESLWDAARTSVGDRDGDGAVDYARIDAIYRESAPRWKNEVRYAQHSIRFLSEYTGVPYPWPHMTSVEGAGIIGGGMEAPMMTIMGGYNAAGDTALYGVTAHELGHMWVPMIVGTDERRYSWMDEGTTSFNGNEASGDFFPGTNPGSGSQYGYIQFAQTGNEGELMRWSDHHYGFGAFGIASYAKPASLLMALRGVLGEEDFLRAYRAFLAAWAFKHPYPWDMFHMFESVSGRDLGWFWRSWYYETWTLDQAIASVEATQSGTRIVIKDLGQVPMPVHLTITREDGEVVDREVPVEHWLAGASTAEVTVENGAAVVSVEIDAERAFPDVDRSNNVWER